MVNISLEHQLKFVKNKVSVLVVITDKQKKLTGFY